MTVLDLDFICDYMQSSNPREGGGTGQLLANQTMSIGENSNLASCTKTMGKRPGKRPGRKPSKIDERAKLERSRQSARECRARKKLRYQYLEELVLNREKAVYALRDELETYKQWCSRLDNGGPVPEAIVKMIVNEELAQKKRQMEQARKAMQKQQQQQQIPQFSSTSSSSSSSTSSTSPEMSHPSSSSVAGPSQHQGQAMQKNVFVIQSGSSSSSLSSPSSSSQLHQHLPKLPQHMKPTTSSAPTLQRQVAFDYSHQQEIPYSHFQPQPSTSSVAADTSIEVSPQQHKEIQELLQQLREQREEKRQLQQQRHIHQFNQQQNVIPIPSTTTPMSSHSLQEFSPLQPLHFHEGTGLQRSPLSTRVKSEPPLKYTNAPSEPLSHSIMDNVTSSQGFILDQANEGINSRSFSNPSSMDIPRLNLTTASDHQISSSTVMSQPSGHTSFLSESLQSSRLLGDFLPTLGISIPITIDDSSSSDENFNEQQLFQSVANTQKRTLSDPIVLENPKRQRLATESSRTNTPSFDPYATLSNLTSVYCFSSTRTSNTPSPSPYGMVPAGIPSPSSSSRYSTGKASSTPSSSATPSPAPLSSLLELSASSPAVSTGIPEVIVRSCSGSGSGLQASIDEPIPHWYSFLEDLEDSSISATTTRQEASSIYSPSVATPPRPQNQPTTPDNQAFMNVPTIIDEMLDDEDSKL